MNNINWSNCINEIPFSDKLPPFLVLGFADDFKELAENGCSFNSDQAEKRFAICCIQAQIWLYQNNFTKKSKIDYTKKGSQYLADFREWRLAHV